MCGDCLILEKPYGKEARRRRATGGDDSGDEGKHGRCLCVSTAPRRTRRRGGADDGDAVGCRSKRPRRRLAGGLHYRGVHQRSYGRWSAEIRDSSRGHRVWIGTYDTAEEAARAYDAEVRRIHGGKAKTNFPPLPPPPPTNMVAPPAAAVHDDGVPWTLEAYMKLLSKVELDGGAEPPPPPLCQPDYPLLMMCN